MDMTVEDDDVPAKRPSPCRHYSMKYSKVAKIGQGTFGEVFKAKWKRRKKFVALKKVLMENEREGFPITALREIHVLKACNDMRLENIVKLLEVCISDEEARAQSPSKYFYMVFEFCEHDLAGLLYNPAFKPTLAQKKDLVKQLLTGLFFLHHHKICHRDIKPANVLITKGGVVKIADFGLSRFMKGSKNSSWTNRVVTLWYRSPELLLGARQYGTEIDMWSVGCLMVELWTKTPLLTGATEQKQLLLTLKLCGSINVKEWPEAKCLPLYEKMSLPENLPRLLNDNLKTYIPCDLCVTFISKLLCLNPAKRLTADEALEDNFFWWNPLPGGLDSLLRKLPQDNFELNKIRSRVSKDVDGTAKNGTA